MRNIGGSREHRGGGIRNIGNIRFEEHSNDLNVP